MTKYQTENIYFYLKESGKTKKKKIIFWWLFSFKKKAIFVQIIFIRNKANRIVEEKGFLEKKSRCSSIELL
jgi:hypothetical protein